MTLPENEEDTKRVEIESFQFVIEEGIMYFWGIFEESSPSNGNYKRI